jgi:Fe-S cluster biosynthesis and repair protein YggX
MKKLKSMIKQLEHDQLSEAFFIEALNRYAKDVLQDDSDWGNSIVSKEAWQDIANKVTTLINN